MKIEIIEGTWKSAAISGGVLRMMTTEGKMERFSEVKEIELVTEETKAEYKKKIGYGIAVGLVTLGIGGLITGLAVGNKEFIEFFCELPDGRAFMGRTEKKGYMSLIKLRPGGKGEAEEKQDPLSKLISR